MISLIEPVKPISRQDIQRIALQHGFSLKEQAPGVLDLHDYVYEHCRDLFARLPQFLLLKQQESSNPLRRQQAFDMIRDVAITSGFKQKPGLFGVDIAEYVYGFSLSVLALAIERRAEALKEGLPLIINLDKQTSHLPYAGLQANETLSDLVIRLTETNSTNGEQTTKSAEQNTTAPSAPAHTETVGEETSHLSNVQISGVNLKKSGSPTELELQHHEKVPHSPQRDTSKPVAAGYDEVYFGTERPQKKEGDTDGAAKQTQRIELLKEVDFLSGHAINQIRATLNSRFGKVSRLEFFKKQAFQDLEFRIKKMRDDGYLPQVGKSAAQTLEKESHLTRFIDTYLLATQISGMGHEIRSKRLRMMLNYLQQAFTSHETQFPDLNYLTPFIRGEIASLDSKIAQGTWAHMKDEHSQSLYDFSEGFAAVIKLALNAIDQHEIGKQFQSLKRQTQQQAASAQAQALRAMIKKILD